jgi:L-rhamnonate dehydratase
MAIEHLNDLALRTAHRVGRIGTASNAMSGVDLALWDLKGKLLGRPVYELLGGPVKDELTCYITTDDLEWAQELGFQKFKISNPTHYSDGDAGIKRAVEHVASSRKKVGDEADLMINPVMSFNVEYALRMLEELKPFHLRWFEEPLPPTNIEGLQTLREAAPWVTIATGEDHYGRHEFLRIVESRGADILQPDIKWCGGLSECVKIHAIGEAAGVTTILHAGANNPYGQHFAMAATESPMGEYFQASDPGIPLNESQRLPGMATPVNGKITVSDAPGFGIDVTESDVTDWEDTGRGALA